MQESPATPVISDPATPDNTLLLVDGSSYIYRAFHAGGNWSVPLPDGTQQPTGALRIMVNMMHFFSSPYLMMYNTLGKINPNLETVGSTMNIPRRKIIFDVILPQARGTIAEMFMYFFVNCMMTISAVSFLSTTSIQPVSLMIPTFESQMLLECAGVVSLLILAVNLLMKFCITQYKKVLARKGI